MAINNYSKLFNGRILSNLFFKILLLVIVFIVLSGLAVDAVPTAEESYQIISVTGPDGKTVTKKVPGNGIVSYGANKDQTTGTFIYDNNEQINVIIRLKQDHAVKNSRNSFRRQGKKSYPKAELESLKSTLKEIDKVHNQLAMDIEKIQTRFSLNQHRQVKPLRNFRYLFNGVSMKLPRGVAAELKKLTYVESVQEDKIVQADLQTSVPLTNADDLWAMGTTGQGIVTAIIDTGIDYRHPDLGGGFGPGYKVIGGYDFVNNDPDPMDDNNHGTHVAGIVAGNGTIRGVAPDAKLMAYKVLNAGGQGYQSDIIAAIERACDPDQNPETDDAVDLLNLSLGGAGNPDDPVCQAVDNAVDAGIICVVAAGNNYNYYTVGSPGCARNAITVGASDQNDQIASFSSKGPSNGIYAIKPDLVAPGVNIYSTAPSASYQRLSGTSMATPHVAGAVALILQLHPDWSPAMVKSALMSSAKDLGTNVFAQGSGRIDVLKAANQKTIVSPASISLGYDDPNMATFSKTEVISIHNTDTNSHNYNISIARTNLPAGINTAIDAPSFVLGPNETRLLTFSITVDNTTVPNPVNPPYSYEGKLVIQSDDAQTSLIAFALVKSASLKMVFDEIPFMVYIHNRMNRMWGFVPAESSMTQFLPDGYYDIITMYRDGQTIVIKENVPTNNGIIAINKNDAIFTISFAPKDERQNPVDCSREFFRLGHKSSYQSVTLMTGFKSQMRISPVSPAYGLEWTIRSWKITNSVYQFLWNTDGVNSNRSFENTPAELRHITFQYQIPPSITRIYPMHWISDRYLSEMAYDSLMKPLEAPFIQEAYYMSSPNQPFYYSYRYSYKSVYQGTTPNSDINNLLYITPLLKVNPDFSLEGILSGSDSPFYQLDASYNKMPVGLGPNFWFAKFNNSGTEIRITPNSGPNLWLFVNQMGDYSPHRNLPYELYQGDQLIKNGNFTTAGEDAYFSWDASEKIPLPALGEYTLATAKTCLVNGTQCLTSVKATFNTMNSDKNPPYLSKLIIVSNGEFTNTINSNQPAEIRFEANDNYGINNVTLYYKTTGDWISLPVTNNGGKYSAAIPGGLDTGYVSLLLQAADNAGNRIAYEINPAFYSNNVNPIKAFDQVVKTHKNTAVNIVLTATNQNNTPLTYAIVSNVAHGQLTGALPNLTYTPSTNYLGPDRLTFQVSDGVHTSNLATVDIVVNSPPAIQSLGGIKFVQESKTLTFEVIASDPDGDPLTYSARNLPLGAVFNQQTHLFSWTPDYSQAGVYRDVVFEVNDGIGSVATSLIISVINYNRPLQWGPLEDKTVTEGETLTFKVIATDPDGDLLTFSAENLPPGAVFDPETQIFTWTPAYGQAGYYPNVCFRVIETIPGGGYGSGVTYVNITVLPAR